ncbi:hypothetical protein D516_2461 [Rhodobacter sp. AKP1]|nr:hypothetical protein D516_2461 [Rhodobacter sp. AKP1]
MFMSGRRTRGPLLDPVVLRLPHADGTAGLHAGPSELELSPRPVRSSAPVPPSPCRSAEIEIFLDPIDSA